MGQPGKQKDAPPDSYADAAASSSSYDLGTYPLQDVTAAASSSPTKSVRQRTRTHTLNGKGHDDDDDDGYNDTMNKSADAGPSSSHIPRPPSFAQSQFATIVRRQRKRRLFTPNADDQPPRDDDDDVEPGWQGATLKVGRSRTTAGPPSRAAPLNDYDFAGWGSMAMLDVHDAHWAKAQQRIAARRNRTRLGQLRAMAVAGNAVTGSVFYALPSVFAVAGVWTPLCLVLAAALMTPTLVVIHALATTLSCGSNAASYSYFLNVCSRRNLALVAGAITLFDAVSTGAVSATTAASYAAAEAAPHLSSTAFSVIFLVTLTALALLGLRDSSTAALCIFSFHNATMLALLTVGAVAWGKHGSATLLANWNDPLATGGSGGKSTARALFDGTVVAFVGLTGFETTVSYAASVTPGSFSKALRNIWLTVTLLEAPMSLIVLAVLPLSAIRSSNDVLALLASKAVGDGMHIYITVDAAVVLCGGVLTGAISCAGLLLAMCADGTLPRGMARLLRTGAPVWCLGAYLALCLVVCATAGFDQLTLSSIFSLAFLAVLTLFSLSSLLAFHSRPLLFTRSATTQRRKLALSPLVVLLSLAITTVALVGNVILSPLALAQAVAYAAVITTLLLVWANRVPLVHLLGVWAPSVFLAGGNGAMAGGAHDEDDDEHANGQGAGVIRKKKQIKSKSKSRDGGLAGWITTRSKAWVAAQRRENSAIFLTSTDSLPHLLTSLLYLTRNEPSVGHLTLAHCYRTVEGIPAELEANHQLLDEAFPHVTVDLVFWEGRRRRRGGRGGEEERGEEEEEGETGGGGGWSAEALEALLIAMGDAEQVGSGSDGGQHSAAADAATMSAAEAKIRSRVFIGCPSGAAGAQLLSDMGEGVRIILD